MRMKKMEKIIYIHTENKLNKIYITLFYIFIMAQNFFSQFTNYYHRKIKTPFSYINLKINGTGKIYSDDYSGDKPNIIIINNKINYTTTEINNTYYFDILENNINNIILIWDRKVESTDNMFMECNKIIEIDLSNFIPSCVKTMKNLNNNFYSHS